MRAALEVNALYTTQAGMARYVRGLLLGLKQLKPADFTGIELAWEVGNFAYRQPQRALKTAYRELIWAKFIAPLRLRRLKPDLLHSTAGYFVKPPPGMPNVITLGDLAVIRFPERFRPWHRRSTLKRMRQLSAASKIICISQFTADEAMQVLGIPGSKLVVTLLGSDWDQTNALASERKPSLDIPSEYFLFVGSLEPGKNLTLLRQVYQLAQDQGISLPPLLIVGARWAGVASEGAPPENWHYLGRQPDPVLVYLYRRSLGLLFPSKYEGFGLPVLEAMALGCPVICSRVASIPEVGGDAALYAELTPASYLQTMRRLATDAACQTEAIKRGYEQASRFSWKRCAAETLTVYREVISAG